MENAIKFLPEESQNDVRRVIHHHFVILQTCYGTRERGKVHNDGGVWIALQVIISMEKREQIVCVFTYMWKRLNHRRLHSRRSVLLHVINHSICHIYFHELFYAERQCNILNQNYFSYVYESSVTVEWPSNFILSQLVGKKDCGGVEW